MCDGKSFCCIVLAEARARLCTPPSMHAAVCTPPSAQRTVERLNPNLAAGCDSEEKDTFSFIEAIVFVQHVHVLARGADGGEVSRDACHVLLERLFFVCVGRKHLNLLIAPTRTQKRTDPKRDVNTI